MKYSQTIAARKQPMLRAIAVLGLAACADTPTGSVAPQDPLVESIVALGFRRDMIVDRGDHFVVEGDISILKATLGETLKPSDPWNGPRPRFQWRTTNLVSSPAVSAIRVNVAGVNANWQTAIRDAMTEWNAITPGAMIKFIEGAPAQITFSMTSALPFADCQNLFVALASWPANGQPGPTVEISNEVTNANCLNAAQKKFNMVHELGHTVGLRHTNWQGNEAAGQAGAIQIGFTPPTDALSVMNGGVALTSWGGFSHYDKVAGFYLYPRPEPNPALPSYPGGVPTFSWSALPDSPSYRIVIMYSWWWVDEYNEYWSGSQSVPGTWTTATSTTYPDESYTGYGGCSTGSGPGSTGEEAYFYLEYQYPSGGDSRFVGLAEVLDC